MESGCKVVASDEGWITVQGGCHPVGLSWVEGGGDDMSVADPAVPGCYLVGGGVARVSSTTPAPACVS